MTENDWTKSKFAKSKIFLDCAKLSDMVEPETNVWIAEATMAQCMDIAKNILEQSRNKQYVERESKTLSEWFDEFEEIRRVRVRDHRELAKK